ncbi:hypothetical protein F5Y01DRAFT_323235, partial [Xylaria sp. FL0043]
TLNRATTSSTSTSTTPPPPTTTTAAAITPRHIKMANAQWTEISFQKLMEEVARDYLFFKFTKARFARAHGIDPLELYHMGLQDGANAGYVEGFRDGAFAEHDRKREEEQKREEEGVEGEAPTLVDITASSRAQNNRRVYDATLLLLIRYGGVVGYRGRFERARSFEDDDEFYVEPASFHRAALSATLHKFAIAWLELEKQFKNALKTPRDEIYSHEHGGI